MPKRSVPDRVDLPQVLPGSSDPHTAQPGPGEAQTALEVRRQARASLGMSVILEPTSTVPVEGHVAEFPLWAFAKLPNRPVQLHIDYGDGTFFELKAFEGMPSMLSPGYLDTLWFYGQKDLFERSYVAISAYRVLSYLHEEEPSGERYRAFVRDMKRYQALRITTNRLRDPVTHEHTHTHSFGVLEGMALAHRGKGESRFYFNQLFLDSFRSGYLRRLDWDFCLKLDRSGKALARFLYGHISKRLGEKSVYARRFAGFLNDVGLGHLLTLEKKRQTERLKREVFPALALVQGQAFSRYELDDRGNIFFFSLPPRI